MIKARVEWKGLEEAQQRIERRVFKLTGKDPAMYGEIQRVVYESTATNFAAQGRPKWKQRKYVYAWPILAKTGKLLDSILSSILRQWEHHAKTHLLKISGMFYGVFHQYGRGQAVRRFLNITDQENRENKAIIKKHLRGE